MRKFGFVTMLMFCGVISSRALAQNYYDPGYFQNSNQGYSGYNRGYSQGYYPQNYGYQQNYAYYQQPANVQNSQVQHRNQVDQKRKQRGAGTVTVGADYVLGYTSFVNEDYTFGPILNTGPAFDYTTRDFDRQSNAISGNFGWRPFKHFGIEAFYTSSLKTSTQENLLSASTNTQFATLEQEISYKAYGIDIIGYYQVNEYIELLASIGVGKYDYEADVTVDYRDIGVNPIITSSNTQTFEDSLTAYRIGGGAQIWLSRHLAFRITGRWVQLGGDLADYITEINMGVRYHF